MNTYIYSYRSDTSNEPIGRVKATSLSAARKKVAVIKQLDDNLIDDLFKIEKDKDHGRQNRKNSR